MTKQITPEEALKLVSFYHSVSCGWQVGDVCGHVRGHVRGHIHGDVGGDVCGNVNGDVGGNVRGKINGRSWESVETPKEKLQRLIEESGNQEMIDTFNQMENN